jgi:hypothetical protein
MNEDTNNLGQSERRAQILSRLQGEAKSNGENVEEVDELYERWSKPGRAGLGLLVVMMILLVVMLIVGLWGTRHPLSSPIDGVKPIPIDRTHSADNADG